VQRLADDLAPSTPLSQIQRAWPAAVGDVIAANAQPVAERDGVVRVYCPQSVWSQEIDLMGEDLAASLNAALGVEMVREVRATARPG